MGEFARLDRMGVPSGIPPIETEGAPCGQIYTERVGTTAFDCGLDGDDITGAPMVQYPLRSYCVQKYVLGRYDSGVRIGRGAQTQQNCCVENRVSNQ